MSDIFGQALLDYIAGTNKEDITTFSSVAGEDRLPVPYLFRDYKNMPVLEQKALALCCGKVLDIGCGSGSHALYLQDKGADVTGLDISAGAIETCRARGLKKSICGDIFSLHGMKFDTIILLMNGIGVAGTLRHLDQFLSKIKALLAPDGRVLLDSSDIIYMYDTEEIDLLTMREIASDKYYGEVSFSMEYAGNRSNTFGWLYLDFVTLKAKCSTLGLSCELVMNGKHYDYLARLGLEK